ncbi:hypothetical protein QE385_003928 [Sphingomonas sp. SORGH_AS 950]|uniref:hypothetical protein n=1 Tax=Sphingomonas sp. SORGH_AS_0950 TaxID=3041792 RepID=UPI0027877D75|nr:hypothetical protein [Sphingomonas sp. SORGH_AS_0950]MDQ1159531.1 hypothetical protein [Sphingomonas sp. SORGH_AS_0950]
MEVLISRIHRITRIVSEECVSSATAVGRKDVPSPGKLLSKKSVFCRISQRLGATRLGVINEPVIAAGRISALHRKFGIDLRSRLDIANGRVAKTAPKIAAAMAIASTLVLFVQQLWS